MPPKPMTLQELAAIQEAMRVGNLHALTELLHNSNIELPPLHIIPEAIPPLHHAVISGNILQVSQILREGCDVNVVVNDNTALDLAIFKHNEEIVRLLLEQPNIQPSTTNSEGHNVLHKAVTNAPEMVELFLEYQHKGLDFNVNAVNSMKITPLQIAIQCSNIASVNNLLQFPGILINYDSGKESPLHNAAYNGNTTILQMLLQQPGIIIDCLDEYGQTPLYHAMIFDKFSCATLLIEKGANIYHKNFKGHSMLHAAFISGNINLVEYVLKIEGFNIDDKNSMENTGLHFAAIRGHLKLVEFFLQLGVTNANTPNIESATPFTRVVEHNNISIVKKFLQFPDQININWSDEKGMTALHFAAQNGNADIAKLLLRHSKIDPYIRNKEGKTALDLSGISNKFETFQILLTAMTPDPKSLNDIIHNPTIDESIRAQAKEKLIQLEVLNSKALDGRLDIAHEKLPDLFICWQEFDSSNYSTLAQIIGLPQSRSISAKQLITEVNIILDAGKESYKLPHILLFAIYLKSIGTPNMDILINNIIHKMHQAPRDYYPEYQDAIEQIAVIGQNIHSLKKVIDQLKETHFIYKPQQELGMHDGEKTLTQLWEEMGRNKFDDISKILGSSPQESIANLKTIAMSNINSMNPEYLPQMLVFSMGLKQLGMIYGDKIIQQVIVRMAEVDVRKTEEAMRLHERYKAAIDEILSTLPAEHLLKDAVHNIEEGFRYEYNMTLLHKVAQTGHEEIIKLLFKAGWINVDPVDNCDTTPLGLATIFNNVNAGKELLKHNPDIIREGTTYQPIAQASHNLSQWKDVFIEYAQSYPTTELRPLSLSLLEDISGAIHCLHISYQELHNFYQMMNFNVTNIGDVLEN